MAAYMRKTGILPVCTNNEARAYFAGKGLTYADVTEGDILALVMLLNKHIKKANADCETSMGSMYLSRRINLKRKTNGTLISCFLYVNSHYFERRKCISFNADGWIGFAGWADQGNTNPILRANEEGSLVTRTPLGHPVTRTPRSSASCPSISQRRRWNCCT